MLILPIQTKNHAHDILIVVLEPDNLARMKEGDPVEIPMNNLGGKVLMQPIVMVCSEEPTPQFKRLVQGGDIKAIIKYLQRGWKFRPDRGDHDRGPESLKGMNLMGQAFNEGGEVIAEAFGKTKQEVFTKLMNKATNAHEVRIKSLPIDPQPDCGAPGDCDMAESPGPSFKDSAMPCRELAATFLDRKIREVEDYLTGLKHLHRIAEKLEPDSPAERILWDSVSHSHRRF